MHLNAMPSPPKFEHNAKVTLPFDSPHLTSLATVVSSLWSAVHELSILSASAALVLSFWCFQISFFNGLAFIFLFPYGALNTGIINESPSNDTLLYYVFEFFF